MQKACPKCDNELRSGARGTSRCVACGGMFIPSALVPYAGDDSTPPAPGEGHDAQSGRCPVDRTILSRAEVSLGDGEGSIHLERCSSCRGIWFDSGEWSLLAEKQLLENIEQFWTAEWRTRQRREQSARDYERRQREEFGEELFATLESLAGKLKGHDRRSQALAWLREASGD
jgi:Zn-finger nucleic acid-binding protein